MNFIFTFIFLNNFKDVTSEDFGAGDISGQPLEGLGNEGYTHPVDDYESFQSQEEDYEVNIYILMTVALYFFIWSLENNSRKLKLLNKK